ncbi:kinase-like protein [Heliocybe sulcata]|uniref:non-specific serine/threonine protein kinase n=1 Tax=Heliocybe sulcata TaxID=5364 RepID=A0A5C3MZW8_9AGAM|nr:kinase-like protein [Heliocybe sulcata]
MSKELASMRASIRPLLTRFADSWSWISCWQTVEAPLEAASSAVPGLPVVVKIVGEIVAMCEGAKSNRAALKQLGDRCENLLNVLKQHAQRPATKRSPELDQAVDDAHIVFVKIHTRLQTSEQDNELRHWVYHKKFSTEIHRCHEDISACVEQFEFLLILQGREWQEDFRRHIDRELEAIVEAIQRTQQVQKIISDLTKIATEGVSALEDKLQELAQSLEAQQRVGLYKTLHLMLRSTGHRLPKFNIKDGEPLEVRGTLLDNEEVLIKTVRVDAKVGRAEAQKRLDREGEVWQKVWDNDKGEHLVQTYGCWDSHDLKELHLVYPYNVDGTADEYIKSNPEVDRIAILLDVAKGLEVLHSLNIMHGEVRGRHVWMNGRSKGLLGDFSLSKILNHIHETPMMSCADYSSYRWFAPEVICTGVQGLRSDIWSFGMTVYELLTDKVPYYETKKITMQGFGNTLAEGAIPKRPLDEVPGLDDELWNFLVNQCWKVKPEERCDIGAVVAFFEMLVHRRRGYDGHADGTYNHEDAVEASSRGQPGDCHPDQSLLPGEEGSNPIDDTRTED